MGILPPVTSKLCESNRIRLMAKPSQRIMLSRLRSRIRRALVIGKGSWAAHVHIFVKQTRPKRLHGSKANREKQKNIFFASQIK